MNENRLDTSNTEILVVPTSINLNNLLSFQDVMKTIEREFHLHEGQEREIIMKLWLKSQSMISILQRYRFLLQELEFNDEDFLSGFKKIRNLIFSSKRDAENLRERVALLENQNVFLEDEFQRQLDRLSKEKNEQILSLTELVEKNFSQRKKNDETNERKNFSSFADRTAVLSEIFDKNAELQTEIESLNTKLDFTFALLNEKFQQKTEFQLLRSAMEKLRENEAKRREIQRKFNQQTDENQILKLFIEKTENFRDEDFHESVRNLEKNTLEREIQMIRDEITLTEKRREQLELRFDKNDENLKLKLEELKLNDDVLRGQVDRCFERLDEIRRENEKFQNEKNFRIEKLEEKISSSRQRYDELLQNCNALRTELTAVRNNFPDKEKFAKNEENFEKKLEQIRKNCEALRSEIDASLQRFDELRTPNENFQREKKFRIEKLEEEISRSRKIYDELVESCNALRVELTNLRRKLNEKEKEKGENLENSEFRYKELQNKFDELSERLNNEKIKTVRLESSIEEKNFRCENLEKEKLEITKKFELISQNLTKTTGKYKEKLNVTKIRCEQIEQENRDLKKRYELLQNEFFQVRQEFNDVQIDFEQTKIREEKILQEKFQLEQRRTNENEQIQSLTNKNRFYEEEFDRLKIQIAQLESNQKNELLQNEIENQLEQLRSKIRQAEENLAEEKTRRESFQFQIKLLEDENLDLREIMAQMRKRRQDGEKDDRDRNDEIQQLIARTEFNARQYMTNFNLTHFSTPSALVRLVPVTTSINVSATS